MASLCLVSVITAQNTVEDLSKRVAELEKRLEQQSALKDPSAQPVDSQQKAPVNSISIRSVGMTTDAAGTIDLDTGPKVSSAIDLRFWGRAKFDVTVDNYTARTQTTDYATYVTSESGAPVNFNPRDSRFGFAASRSFDEWTARAVVSLDFYGNNVDNSVQPRMRLGYAELISEDKDLSIRAGQDWNPIAQQNPGMLDFGIMSWSGNLWHHLPQVTMRKKFDKIEVLATVMKQRISNSVEFQESMPWIAARVAHHGIMGDRGLLALNASFRKNSVSVTGANNTSVDDDVTSYLVAAEWQIPFGEKVEVKGEAWMGQGIGRSFLRYGLDYSSNTTTNTAQEIESWGGFVSVELQASDKMSFNGGFGIDDPKDSDIRSSTTSTLDGSTIPFLMNQTAFINGKYALSKNYGFGLEVQHHSTKQLSGACLKGQRVLMSNWFIF